MSLAKWMGVWVLVGLCTSVSFALAQEGGAPGAFSGKGSVTQPLDSDKSTTFDIGGGVTMTFPRGLPVGHSRLVTLKKSNKRVKPSQIHEKFKAIGNILEFDGALNTAGKPILLSLEMKRDPSKPGQKLVIAVEIATFCEAHNKAFKLSNGLCSGWELQEAEYVGGRIIGKLRSTGGMRLQFGLVPEASD